MSMEGQLSLWHGTVGYKTSSYNPVPCVTAANNKNKTRVSFTNLTSHFANNTCTLEQFWAPLILHLDRHPLNSAGQSGSTTKECLWQPAAWTRQLTVRKVARRWSLRCRFPSTSAAGWSSWRWCARTRSPACRCRASLKRTARRPRPAGGGNRGRGTIWWTNPSGSISKRHLLPNTAAGFDSLSSDELRSKSVKANFKVL